MRRKMSSKAVHSTVKYTPLTEKHDNEKTANYLEDENNMSIRKKKGILCKSSKKRMYLLIFLTGVVLVWLCIYYKLLNHRFDLPEPFRELRRLFGDGPSKNRRFRESETENVEVSNQHQSEVVHIVVVACGPRVTEALVNLKTITIMTNYILSFYIFTDKKSYEHRTFDKILSTWPSFTQHRMMFKTYPVIYPENVIEDEERDEWLGLFKQCASFRLFIAKELKNVDSVIYVDTDILFLQPPENLWNYFKMFDSHQIAGLTSECEKGQKFCWYKRHASHPYFEPYGVNTGVMLMNLTRMRALDWDMKIVEIYRQYKDDLRFGDQDLINIYFNQYPRTVYILPCSWNYRPEFCMEFTDTPLCVVAYTKGISILHGSRQSFQKNKVQPEFKAIFDIYKMYKFGESIEKSIVNLTKHVFEKEFSHTPCGRFVGSMLDYIYSIN